MPTLQLRNIFLYDFLMVFFGCFVLFISFVNDFVSFGLLLQQCLIIYCMGVCVCVSMSVCERASECVCVRVNTRSKLLQNVFQ